ncbi:MAG: hypothetical protein RI601_05105 [Desulfurivibrionaceae bacterium]|nr:hypothetical protein [Desulfurivibrionaceae bacterium]
MEIPPDLSICLLPARPDADLTPCLAALLACADPLLLEIFLPLGVGCGDFHDAAQVHFVDLPSAPAGAFIEQVWQQARGRYLGLWQSGVMATPASLRILVEFLDDHPDVAVAGPRFFNGQADILATAFARRRLLPLADPVMTGWDGLRTMEVDWLSGAALVMNRLALTDMSVPGNSLGGIWERCLCRRLQGQGWHIFFVHLARVVSEDRYCEPASFWERCLDNWRQLWTRWLNR